MKPQSDSKTDTLFDHTEEVLIDRDKFDRLMQMSRHLAHEFNNLLTTILANTQLALLVVEDERVSSHLEIVEEVTGEAGIMVSRFQESLHVLARSSGQEDI